MFKITSSAKKSSITFYTEVAEFSGTVKIAQKVMEDVRRVTDGLPKLVSNIMSRCFTMLKPGVVNRRLVGEVISRLEKKGFKLVGLKMVHVSKDLASAHYAEHLGKPFYEDLVGYITAGPVIAMVWQADDCVALMRKFCGPTKPSESMPGTIRGDYCIHTERNIIHA